MTSKGFMKVVASYSLYFMTSYSLQILSGTRACLYVNDLPSFRDLFFNRPRSPQSPKQYFAIL